MPRFTADTNTYGPFDDGRVVYTGLAWKTEPRFEDRPNSFGGVTPYPVGTFAHAKSVNGVVTVEGEWKTRD